MKSTTLSRRSLLKGIGLLGAATALGVHIDYANIAHAASNSAAQKKDGWYFGHCRMCMRGTCPNMYRVENGIVVEVQGNPATPTSKGALCSKGQSIIQNLYNPYRVKAPMRRTNPKKGLNEDPRWIEISWEEALSTTANVLKDIRQRDPRRFVYEVGFGDMDFFCTFLFYFASAYGTPNYLKTNGALCVLHYASDLVHGVFPGVKPDATFNKYLLAIGMNLGMGISSSDGGVRGLLDRLFVDQNMKVVCVDPHCGPDASKTEWIPIKPGGELAFMMGVIHSILYEIKKMDFEFLKWQTTAPYLIGPDGYYARGEDGKPQIYDASDNTIKSFDDPSLKDPDIDIIDVTVNGAKACAAFTLVREGFKTNTPEWASQISGIPAAKIREVAKDFIENASIGETIALENSKGETILLPKRTSACESKRGIKNMRDGVANDLMTKMLNMLVGSLDVPGGMLGTQRGPFLSPDEDGVVKPKGEARWVEPSYPPQHVNLAEYFPHRHTIPVLAHKVIRDPKKFGLEYEIDAILTVGGNAIASTSEPYVIADAYANVPFSATVAYHYDEIAHMADILFASHAMLEKESVNCYEGAFDVYTKETITTRVMMYRDPVTPLYNTYQPQDIIIELCERIGMLKDFNEGINQKGVWLGEVTCAKLAPEDQLAPDQRYSIAEIWDKGVRTYFGKSLEDMKKDGIIVQRMAPADAYNASFFKKGETRHPIYFDRLKRSGELLRNFFTAYKDQVYIPDFNMEDQLQYFEAVIKWRPKKITEVKKGNFYDMTAIQWKTPTSPMRIGGNDQMPWLNEVSENFDPSYGKICLNTETAKEKGVQEGDTIWVESENGKIKGQVHITELLFPDVVGIPGSLGRVVKSLGEKAFNYPMYNKLTNGKISDSCAVTAGVANSVPVRITLAS